MKANGSLTNSLDMDSSMIKTEMRLLHPMFVDHLEKVTEFYAKMALDPGWIDFARHEVREMEKHPTGLYKGIGKRIGDRIKEMKQ